LFSLHSEEKELLNERNWQNQPGKKGLGQTQLPLSIKTTAITQVKSACIYGGCFCVNQITATRFKDANAY